MNRRSSTTNPPPANPAASRAGWIPSDLAICCGLLVLVLGVFSFTLLNGFVNFDDDVYIYANPQVSSGFSWSGITWAFTGQNETGNWHPLTWLSHMLDCQVYGLRPWGHHLTSILLFAATVILLFLVLKHLTNATWPSAIVAAVFAVHPLRVESVAWAAERKDVLSGAFFMLTLFMYVRYVEQLGKPSGRHKLFYGLMLLFFAVGLMSKSMLITLPFVLLLLDFWPLKRFSRSTFWRLILEKAPFFLLAIVAGIVALLTQRASGGVQLAHQPPLALRLANAMVSYVTYLGKMFWPRDLTIFYPYSPEIPVWKIIGAASLLLVITALAIASARRRPYLFTGWFWYLGMLLPVIGIIQAGGQAMADRYSYLPQIGLYVMITWGVKELVAGSMFLRPVVAIATGAVVLVLSLCTVTQISYWRTSKALWTHALAINPENAMAENTFGIALMNESQWDEAIEHFQKAIELRPDRYFAYNGLGFALMSKGRLDEAARCFVKSIQLKPDVADTYYYLGATFAKQSRAADAIIGYQKAIELDPGHVPAHLGLAWLLATGPDASLRDGNKAVGLAQQAVQLAKQASPELYDTLAAAYAEAGQFAMAANTAQRALKLAVTANNKLLADAIGKRVELYKANTPYRESPH